MNEFFEEAMNFNVIRLEKIRQNMEGLSRERGRIVDLLDGHTSMGHVFTTLEIESFHREDAEYARQFHTQQEDFRDLLFRLRAEGSPEIAEWVGIHKDALKKILAEPRRIGFGFLQVFRRVLIFRYPNFGDPFMHGVRMKVAGATLQEWDKLLKGEVDFIMINNYFLRDYDKKMRRWLRRAEMTGFDK